MASGPFPQTRMHGEASPFRGTGTAHDPPPKPAADGLSSTARGRWAAGRHPDGGRRTGASRVLSTAAGARSLGWHRGAFRPGSTPAGVARILVALLAVSVLSGCGRGAPHAARWDGRRGYDGNGDYGYGLDASRAEAGGHRVWAAARAYPVPGTPDDPWGPHIGEAATRFGVPERWIREVMRQESGGRLYGADGLPITSSAGAMGLMQVMPRTYDTLRRRHGLGADPYEPRDNILAGAAYIREMHDRYGAPGFLAAYNAGPNRVDACLSGATILPDETVDYLASVAPRLGIGLATSGPLAACAGGGAMPGYGVAYASEADRAYAGGGMTGADYHASSTATSAAAAADPTLRAFDGGGLVTPEAPTGVLRTRPRH